MQGAEARVVGVLFGLAAGDRIGGPLRMALEVAESLRDRGSFDPEDIGARYVRWWRSGKAFDTGATAAQVLELASSGMRLEDAAIQVDQANKGRTAGCNPLHRVAPLAMLAAIEDSLLESAAKAEARLTHRHPLAGDAAAAVAVLCRALIRGVPWTVALDIAAFGRLPETRHAIEQRSPGGLERDGFAPNVLRAALHFVDASSSFSAALARSIDFAGPANYSPVLVGTIAGARWGRTEIGDSAFSHHCPEVVSRLRSAASDLAGGWADARSIAA